MCLTESSLNSDEKTGLIFAVKFLSIMWPLNDFLNYEVLWLVVKKMNINNDLKNTALIIVS